MDFWGPYLFAMRERAPKMFMQLRRSGQLEEHLQQRAAEADRMYEDLVQNEEKWPNGLVKNPNARAAAEEQVRATLIEFPEEPDQTPVPPPTSRPKASR